LDTYLTGFFNPNQMKNNSLGLIGGGRITKIFLQALQNKNYNLSDVVV